MITGWAQRLSISRLSQHLCLSQAEHNVSQYPSFHNTSVYHRPGTTSLNITRFTTPLCITGRAQRLSISLLSPHLCLSQAGHNVSQYPSFHHTSVYHWTACNRYTCAVILILVTTATSRGMHNVTHNLHTSQLMKRNFIHQKTSNAVNTTSETETDTSYSISTD